jgi:hypothetical protein
MEPVMRLVLSEEQVEIGGTTHRELSAPVCDLFGLIRSNDIEKRSVCGSVPCGHDQPQEPQLDF